MSEDTSLFKRFLLFAFLAAVAVALLFWRDARQRFAELSVQPPHGGMLDDQDLRAAQGAHIGPVDAQDAAPGYLVSDLHQEIGGRDTVLQFRLRATGKAPAYPALAVVLRSEAGQALRTLLFTPTAYGHAAVPGDEEVQLRVVPRAGEYRVTVRAIDVTLLSLPAAARAQ